MIPDADAAWLETFIVSGYITIDNGDTTLQATPWCQIAAFPAVVIRGDITPFNSMTFSYTTPVIMNSPGTVQWSCQEADRTSTPNTSVTVAQVEPAHLLRGDAAAATVARAGFQGVGRSAPWKGRLRAPLRLAVRIDHAGRVSDKRSRTFVASVGRRP